MAGLGETETDIVVTVCWIVPVTVGGSHVLRFVVPRAAAHRPTVSSGPLPLEVYFIEERPAQPFRIRVASMAYPALH